jgi:type IV pilus assembly protein PilE
LDWTVVEEHALKLHSPDSNTKRNGFTLIELMVTVAIVAILAAIAFPSYQQYVIRGKRSAAKAAMMDLANREQQYLLANRLYADTAALTGTGYAPDSDVTQHYSWAVTVNNAATPPNFTITFTGTGGQASDGALTLNSQGTKTPVAKWER